MKQLRLISVFCIAWSVSAQLGPANAFDGKWAIEEAGEKLPTQVAYDIGSKSSIVTERFGKELSVLYREGQDLWMIHFCNAGNQARLKLNKEKSSLAVVVFETVGVSNLSGPDAAHVQKIVYTILDSHRLDVEIVWQRGGSNQFEKYRFDKI